MKLLYAKRQKGGRNFVCIVPADRTSSDLNAEERQFIKYRMVLSECTSNVFAYASSAVSRVLEALPEFEYGKKAKDILDYMEDEGYLDAPEADDEEL